MHRETRSPPAVVVPLLVLIAIFGYVIGIRRAPSTSVAASGVTSEEKTRIASGASVLLEYPSSWRPAVSAPAIPGLSIAGSLLLSPGGDSARAGLLSGQLSAGEPGPLPSRFLSLVRHIPHTEIANLLNAEAYKYSHMSISGYDRTLAIYVIPNPGDTPTVLACYASKGSLTYLSQCEEIVAKLTLVGRSSYDLSPNAGYGRQLGGLIRALDERRLTLRRQIRRNSTPAAARRLATALADQFAIAATSLGTVEPPLMAGQAQAALAGSMLRARDTYSALAAAAAAEGSAGYDAAQGRVDAAEASVEQALESFALLGYGHT